MKRLLLALLLMSTLGCQKLVSPTFISAVKEHRQDTVLVNQSLIDTFKDMQAEETRPEAKEAYQEIINNLETVSRQSIVLDDYVWDRLTEDELSLYLKSKWRAR